LDPASARRDRRHATIEGDLSLEDLKLDVAMPSEEAC
jgi:hypothetical protein